jgi:hypothetical protein
MADLTNIQPGNWLQYLPERQYCTFVSQDKYAVVEVYNGRRSCSPEELGFIRVTFDVLSACKFTMLGARWTKKVGKVTLTISYADNKPYLSTGNGMAILVVHVHSIQNAYKELTGELYVPNIYGIHPPD